LATVQEGVVVGGGGGEGVIASTGTLFTGDVIRRFTDALKLQSDSNSASLLRGKNSSSNNNKGEPVFPKMTDKACRQWAVVTTINPPTDSVRSVANLTDWCMVIVGDTKTPNDYMERAGFVGPSYENDGRIVFLSATEQAGAEMQRSAFVQMIPYRSFARKNIGFLFAIRHGARIIYDFDDDNVLLRHAHDDEPFISPFGLRGDDDDDDHDDDDKRSRSVLVRHLPEIEPNPITPAFNPLPLMHPTAPETWPRGFPLELVKDANTTGVATKLSYGSLPISSIGVIQAVCNGDPDVDAVYRLTRPLPFEFDQGPATASKLVVPLNAYAPYNAQATVHMYDAFWGLLLPYTVPGRVTDIWRSYFTQRILHDLNLAVVYAPPLVTHVRTPHNYIADMQAETDLYQKTSTLLNFLEEWKDKSPTVAARVENLCVALYERDYIGLADVYAMQEWLLALLDVGYEFPTLPQKEQPPPPPSTALSIREEQAVLHDQPFSTTPVFNVGGPNGVTYAEYLAQNKVAGNTTHWNEWLKGVVPDNRPKNTVLKFVAMMKDEWPLMKDWVYYNGELLGFDNLYILDGSTDPQCISFLVYARDHLGVNVIFTPANLNQLANEMSFVGKRLSGSSDFIMKVDADEFIALKTENYQCQYPDAVLGSSCAMSSYPLIAYLADHKNNLGKLASGPAHRIGYCSQSVPSRELCEAGEGDEIGRLNFFDRDLKKAVSDSRTINGVDLGGHDGNNLPPFNQQGQAKIQQKWRTTKRPWRVMGTFLYLIAARSNCNLC